MCNVLNLDYDQVILVVLIFLVLLWFVIFWFIVIVLVGDYGLVDFWPGCYMA